MFDSLPSGVGSICSCVCSAQALWRGVSVPAARITEVSEVLGVPVPTIRSWERRYKLLAPARTQGGHRRYEDAEVVLLREMRDEVARGRSAKRAAEVVLRRAASMDSGADDLVRAASAFDPQRIRMVLDEAVALRPFEEVLLTVVFPALSRVGQLWSSESTFVAEEHFLTEEVRRFFARVAAGAPAPFRPFPLVLAAAPDELHTLGLEAFAVVLARRGWSCRVLGARTPVDAMLRTLKVSGAGAAVVTAQRSTARRSAAAALHALARTGVPTFYAGSAFLTSSVRSPLPGRYLGEEVVPAADLLEEALKVPPSVPAPPGPLPSPVPSFSPVSAPVRVPAGV